jgi:hypothetical protein
VRPPPASSALAAAQLASLPAAVAPGHCHIQSSEAVVPLSLRSVSSLPIIPYILFQCRQGQLESGGTITKRGVRLFLSRIFSAIFVEARDLWDQSRRAGWLLLFCSITRQSFRPKLSSLHARASAAWRSASEDAAYPRLRHRRLCSSS